MPKQTNLLRIFSLAILTASAFTFLPQICTGQEISFRKQIQPLLANKCLACHGPDEKAREAELRLDTEAGAKESVIVSGNAKESELIARVLSKDPDSVMPPPEHETPLNQAEQKLLQDWINQGASWQRHWAFEPIKQPTLPEDKSGWSKNQIDHFVLRKIRDAQLEPSKRADDRTLIRRIYFDLIGLPPSPDQVKQFVNDSSSNRLEKVVDLLLASPHYGEQMAVTWLDIARFADTNGFQNDFKRSMWVWRDWVIEAYNKNMPIDQFIKEQIAGDMLPNATKSQLIASAFNRNNPSVTEGGSILEEWRIENCVDRTETTAAAFLGLTIGCARCHDHKYDPVSQKEFYEFFAFFNNIDEKGVYTERRGNAPPLIKTPTKKQIAALKEIDLQIKTLEEKAAKLRKTDPNEKLNRWRKDLAKKSAAESKVAKPIWSVEGTPQKESEWSPAGVVIQLNGKENKSIQKNSPKFQFKRDQAFSWMCWIHGDARGTIFGKMDEPKQYRGVDTTILGDGRLKVHLISSWTPNAIAVLSKNPLPDNWTHVAVTYNGNQKASGIKIFFNGKPITTTTERDKLTGPIVTDVPLKIGQRNNSSHLKGKISNFQLFDKPITIQQIARTLKQNIIDHVDQVKVDRNRKAADLFLKFSDEFAAERNTLNAKRRRLLANQQTTMVMRERKGKYRPTWELVRGQYDKPKKDVDLWPSIPNALPKLSEHQPKNRLGLANWLVDDRNPLVARVIVNRAWQKFFGRGLVDPPDNFGIQGMPPSHPQLLDWLADDFRKNGWNLKRLHRQIVLSATYQQASDSNEKKQKLDRDNRWLSRGPRTRLSAEQIRDNALSISGLLDKRVGGPSVFPYQPGGLWDELAGGANGGPYKLSRGGNLYRRSLYTYRKRTVPHPTTSTFDAPSWEKCQVKRAKTNTPLQSLALLNDKTYVEAARKFAERILAEGGDSIDKKIEFATILALSRKPTAIELQVLKQGHQFYLEHYQKNQGEAKKLLAVGQSISKTSNPAHLAAMTSVASVILNLDQTITKE